MVVTNKNVTNMVVTNTVITNKCRMSRAARNNRSLIEKTLSSQITGFQKKVKNMKVSMQKDWSKVKSRASTKLQIFCEFKYCKKCPWKKTLGTNFSLQFRHVTFHTLSNTFQDFRKKTFNVKTLKDTNWWH